MRLHRADQCAGIVRHEPICGPEQHPAFVIGRPVAAGIADRVISIGADDIRRIPTVIAVASEEGKARAILGALQSDMVKVLATSASNARQVVGL